MTLVRTANPCIFCVILPPSFHIWRQTVRKWTTKRQIKNKYGGSTMGAAVIFILTLSFKIQVVVVFLLHRISLPLCWNLMKSGLMTLPFSSPLCWVRISLALALPFPVFIFHWIFCAFTRDNLPLPWANIWLPLDILCFACIMHHHHQAWQIWPFHYPCSQPIIFIPFTRTICIEAIISDDPTIFKQSVS